MLQGGAVPRGADVADESRVPLHHVVPSDLPGQRQAAADHLAPHGAGLAVVVVLVVGVRGLVVEAPPDSTPIQGPVQAALAVRLGRTSGRRGHALAQRPHPWLPLRTRVHGVAAAAAGRLGSEDGFRGRPQVVQLAERKVHVHQGRLLPALEVVSAVHQRSGDGVGLHGVEGGGRAGQRGSWSAAVAVTFHPTAQHLLAESQASYLFTGGL